MSCSAPIWWLEAFFFVFRTTAIECVCDIVSLIKCLFCLSVAAARQEYLERRHEANQYKLRAEKQLVNTRIQYMSTQARHCSDFWPIRVCVHPRPRSGAGQQVGRRSRAKGTSNSGNVKDNNRWDVRHHGARICVVLWIVMQVMHV